MEENKKQPTFGRAFNACVNSDWAITKEGLRDQVLAIAARLNSAQAVEAYRSEALEYTWSVTVRDGVAIIPVTGPIFRYANLFTYYSGGTSVSLLARDFQAAIDNPDIYAILFEINSPGGEVTGINEFAEMVFRARSIKPMSARVGGLGCSAAYWIASACGDVVVDDTAQLGSIGVMTVYLDDRKNLEMRGFEELEFISSQSPYKNSPPYKSEGKQRIQKRIDALAQVFVEKVARNRDVSTETVLKDFGQGDCLVGQDAIDAGLADRFGSFEETLRLLAKAHSPHYRGAPDEEDSSARANRLALENSAANSSRVQSTSTLNLANGVISITDKAEENLAPPALNNLNQTEKAEDEIMINKKENTETLLTEQIAAGGAEEALAKKTEADFSAREKDLKEREKVLADKEAAAEKIRLEAEEKIQKAELAEIAKDFIGNASGAKTEFVNKLANAFGRDSALFTAYVEEQKAFAEADKTNALFSEKGISGADTDNSSVEKLEQLAAGRAKEKNISKEKAMTEILSENPKLYRG